MRTPLFLFVCGLLVSFASSTQAQSLPSSALSSPAFSSSFSLSSSTSATFAGKLLSRSSGLSASPRATADSFGLLKQRVDIWDSPLWTLLTITIVLTAAATLVALIGNLVASVSGKGNLLRGWGIMGVITFGIGIIASTLFLTINYASPELLGIGLGLLGLTLGGLVYSSINFAWGIRLGRSKVSVAPYVAPGASGRLQGGFVFQGTF